MTTISPVNTKERSELDIRPGDTVRVYQKVIEKGKTRLQPFEGLVLARKHGAEPGATFTVRKVSSGVGIERIFPLYSPSIDKIEIMRRAKVRRAKLYYIRKKVAREIRRQMRRMEFVNLGTESETDQATAREKAAQEAEEQAAQAAEEQAQAEVTGTEEAEVTPETNKEAEDDSTPEETATEEASEADSPESEETKDADEEEKK